MYVDKKKTCIYNAEKWLSVSMNKLFIYVPDPESSSGKWVIEPSRPCERYGMSRMLEEL